ncbi:hypothetical protein E2C01_035365 [Portunus trituberculatus]|uniref:Uncharacterized protein n=1 Tax=Portunus trituberculatus TaxID=210409 RepID=A0A5B7F5I3_PORTR|nr:hypothetical protein [Portunus trituberculatus]
MKRSTEEKEEERKIGAGGGKERAAENRVSLINNRGGNQMLDFNCSKHMTLNNPRQRQKINFNPSYSKRVSM